VLLVDDSCLFAFSAVNLFLLIFKCSILSEFVTFAESSSNFVIVKTLQAVSFLPVCKH